MNKKLIYLIGSVIVIILILTTYWFVGRNKSISETTGNNQTAYPAQSQNDVYSPSSLATLKEQADRLALQAKIDAEAKQREAAQKAAIENDVAQASDQAIKDAASRNEAYIKETSVVFMTDAEKALLKLPPETRAQVLIKNKKGDIISYKIINTDADILGKW
ncbi:MAG: hypothetical protein WCK59_04015 [Candidatus Falkowbacteria bacterium]